MHAVDRNSVLRFEYKDARAKINPDRWEVSVSSLKFDIVTQ